MSPSLQQYLIFDMGHRSPLTKPDGRDTAKGDEARTLQRRPKDLVIDDDAAMRAVVHESLKAGGFDVAELGNPVSPSSVVDRERPDDAALFGA